MMVTPNTLTRMKFDFKVIGICFMLIMMSTAGCLEDEPKKQIPIEEPTIPCLLYTSPSPRD